MRTLSRLTFRFHVTFFLVAAVVAAARLFFAQAQASMRERVRSGTQLDGTVVAVVAWCCVLPLVGGGVGGGVVVCCCGCCWFPVVSWADVLCLRCGAGCS